MPEDDFTEDLIGLPFWDSVDWLHYVFSVELKARVKIPKGVFDQILQARDQDSSPTLRVQHVVKATAMAAYQ